MRTLHIGLRVEDLDQSLAYYTALGYEVLGGVPATPLGSLTMLKLPGDEFVTIELVHDPHGHDTGPGGLSHLVISTADLHATLDQLAERGVEAEPPSSPDGSDDFWTTWLTDPDGNRIEMVQWPEGHPEGMTQVDLQGPDGQS
jgi:lactoylglutathione lyase